MNFMAMSDVLAGEFMNIEIWSVGKESESFIAEGVAHYLKKARPYVNITLQILQPPRGLPGADAVRIRLAEETLILQRLQPSNYFILLDERGTLLDSPGWAKAFQELMNRSTKTAVLLIGGAHGVSDAVRARAAAVWSLSALVFPHQLVRLVVAEQVYRAYSILAGSPYHHT